MVPDPKSRFQPSLFPNPIILLCDDELCLVQVDLVVDADQTADMPKTLEMHSDQNCACE